MGEVQVYPATPDRWDDLVALFGERGACGGCWCMFWRLGRKEFDQGKGEPNKAGLRALVEGGEVPGLLAYVDGKPVGWVALAPREAYSRLERTRNWRPLDDRKAWCVTCFFVAKPYRRQGLSVALLEAASRHAFDHGAEVVEGYATEAGATQPDPFVYTGLTSAFRKAGFEAAARPSAGKAIMRRGKA